MSVEGTSQSWADWASETVDYYTYGPSEIREDLSNLREDLFGSYEAVKDEAAAAVEYVEQRAEGVTRRVTDIIGATGEAGSKVAGAAATGAGLGIGTSLGVWLAGSLALAGGAAYFYFRRP